MWKLFFCTPANHQYKQCSTYILFILQMLRVLVRASGMLLVQLKLG